MKPSAPGLLFVGSFLITYSISLLVIGLFKLIGGTQMQRLVPGSGVLGSGDGSRTPLEHAVGAEVACDLSWSLREYF